MPATTSGHPIGGDAMQHRASVAITSASLLVFGFAIACGGGEPPPSPPSSAAQTGSDAQPSSAATTPEPPAGNGVALEQPAAKGSVVDAGGLRFELPPTFEREPPASEMRLAQAIVKGEAGAAELAVFHFGAGQGGSVEANFERWLAQVQRPAGAAGPQRGKLTAGTFEVQWIEAAGTMLPSGMGPGPQTPQPGSRLLGAVVEGAGGPWFFKLTGPDATVSAAREPFLAMLRGLRAAE
jgi:hypothetical protein